MKNIILLILTVSLCTVVMAQDFNKSLASAKSAYTAGNLEDARFNLENALREVDVAIGKEVMKVLPTSLGSLAYNSKDDNVSGMSSSFAGLYVHRTYGTAEDKNANIDIISDSPMLAGINALLAMPVMMNSGDNNQKVTKIQGYKTLLTKQVDENNQTTGYDVQTPFGNSMLTLHYTGNITEAEILKLANMIPIEKVIAIAQ
ncbi:MAG TPA: hypothetical protein VGK39_07980 [Cyclobacteriaceae bacterium]